jgi:tetratricopeptide (TPR) repeat protein
MRWLRRLSLGIAFGLLMLHSPAAVGKSQDESEILQTQLNEVFDIANEEFKAGNYQDAAGLYEGILSSFKLKNTDIYYNLGNAYFKLGRYGKAIASYRKALLLSPREQDVLANLRVVRSRTRDKLDSPRSTELFRDLFFFHYDVNRSESELIFLIAYGMTALFGAVGLFWKSKAMRWTAAAGLALTVIFASSTMVHAYREAHPSDAVVVAAEADLHTGPGDSYLTTFNLHDGAELYIHDRTKDWYQVELSDGRRGWIAANSIELI